MQVVGPSFAKEIVFTARRFSATEALARGLVNDVRSKAQLETWAISIATRIADNAPLTLKSVKLAVSEISKAHELRDRAALQASVRACFESEDYAEGARAFLEKRRPDFKGR